MYATFDHCESLKTNMAAFQWHVCLFQRLCKDFDIFLLSKCFTDCFSTFRTLSIPFSSFLSRFNVIIKIKL